MVCVLPFIDEFAGKCLTVHAEGIIPIGGSPFAPASVADRRDDGAKALRVMPRSARVCTLSGGTMDLYEIVEQSAQSGKYARGSRDGRRGAHLF